MRTEKIKLSSIRVPEHRLRKVDNEKVRKIASSMEAIGQLQPIEVAPIKDMTNAYDLVFGEYRFYAAKSLGWQEIDALLTDGDADADTLRLREIDENIARSELTPEETGDFYITRWQVNQRTQDKRRGLPKVLDAPKQLENADFYAETAGLAGLHPETVRLAIRRRRQLNAVWADLKELDPEATGQTLDRLRKVSDPSLVLAFARDNQCSVADALKSLKPARPAKQKSAADALKVLRAAWKACPAKQRDQFISWLREAGEL